jgi:hypothetical protein
VGVDTFVHPHLRRFVKDLCYGSLESSGVTTIVHPHLNPLSMMVADDGPHRPQRPTLRYIRVSRRDDTVACDPGGSAIIFSECT